MEKRTEIPIPYVKAAEERARRAAEFDIKVGNFCREAGITQQEVALRAGANYNTMVAAMGNKTAGHDVVPVVSEYIDSVRKLWHEREVE